MIEGNSFAISAINFKETKHLAININRAVHALILGREADIAIICQEKKGNDLVITPKQPLYPSNLDNKLNQVLRDTSKVVKKNLNTHSFRIGLTTSLIEVGKVEVAQKIIIYANLTTTAVYNRAQYKEKDFSRLMRKAETFRREKVQPRQYRKKELLCTRGVALHKRSCFAQEVVK